MIGFGLPSPMNKHPGHIILDYVTYFSYLTKAVLDFLPPNAHAAEISKLINHSQITYFMLFVSSSTFFPTYPVDFEYILTFAWAFDLILFN